MSSIFVSHSVKDTRWRQAIDIICARAGVRSDCMEFEKLGTPPCEEIKRRIESSSAVFVVIGDNFPIKLLHTNNWIAFEIGIAYAKNKDVWVIENLGQAKPFAIPMLSHYVLCNIDWLEGPPPSLMFNHLRKMITSYADGASLDITSTGEQIELGWLVKRLSRPDEILLKRRVPLGQPRYMAAKCKNVDCGIKFILHSNVAGFSCPSCRKPMASPA